MSIFEDVILNARSAMDAVGKKAGQVIDISKLKLATVDLKSELAQKFQILGNVVYEEKITGKDFTKNKNELIEKITELKAQLDSINDIIANNSQKVKCPVCGTYNAKNSVFCNKCGEKIETEETSHMSTDDMIDFTEDNFDDDDLI